MKHIKRLLIALLILLITLPGAAVAATRYTGYINKDTYVYKRPSTSSDKVEIARNTKVYVIGASGRFFMVQNPKNSVKGYVLKSCVSKKKTADPSGQEEDPVDPGDSGESGESGDPSDPLSWKSKVVKLDWNKQGKDVMKRGSYGYLYDIKKGIKLRIKRMGGTKHADVEPATAADTAKLKKIAGGKFSWVCHPMILQAGGQYVACSINTMPHGDQTITNNNYNGQFCLHMVNSRTHGTNKINPEHQKCIRQAYNWAHGIS